jgi:hypothetical protein
MSGYTTRKIPVAGSSLQSMLTGFFSGGFTNEGRLRRLQHGGQPAGLNNLIHGAKMKTTSRRVKLTSVLPKNLRLHSNWIRRMIAAKMKLNS